MRLFTTAGLAILAASAHAADWSHWRGPNRDGTTAEDSGWERGAWPPKQLWRANVGTGSTSPLVVSGCVYTMGWDGSSDNVFCLDAATGKELWRTSFPCPRFGRNATGDQGMYGGPTATPEYDAETGFLYTLSVDGNLNCWDTGGRGRRVWSLNLYDRYRMRQRPGVGNSPPRDYGYTTSPLVYRDWLLVEVGGNAGALVAFDKRTGEQRWASQAKDLAGHTGGPALMQVDGVPCVVSLTFGGLLVGRLDKGREGETVAHYPYQTEFANGIAAPAEGRDAGRTGELAGRRAWSGVGVAGGDEYRRNRSGSHDKEPANVDTAGRCEGRRRWQPRGERRSVPGVGRGCGPAGGVQ